MKWFEAYGPRLIKGLARLGGATGFWTLRNADSFSLYALAKYIQKCLGNIYPHPPLAPVAPSGVEFPLVYPGVFTIYPNGTGDLDPETNITSPATWSLSEGVCAAFDDVDTATESAAWMTVTGMPLETDYPPDYLSNWSSWAGLTPTMTTTTATPTTTGTISIYSENDFTDDHYLITGHSKDSLNTKCSVIADLGTTDTATSSSCHWYSGGSYTSCDESLLTQPLSWQLTGTGAICTAYDNHNCDNDEGKAQAYLAYESCINYSKDNSDTETWIALKCGI